MVCFGLVWHDLGPSLDVIRLRPESISMVFFVDRPWVPQGNCLTLNISPAICIEYLPVQWMRWMVGWTDGINSEHSKSASPAGDLVLRHLLIFTSLGAVVGGWQSPLGGTVFMKGSCCLLRNTWIASANDQGSVQPAHEEYVVLQGSFVLPVSQRSGFLIWVPVDDWFLEKVWNSRWILQRRPWRVREPMIMWHSPCVRSWSIVPTHALPNYHPKSETWSLTPFLLSSSLAGLVFSWSPICTQRVRGVLGFFFKTKGSNRCA